MQDNPSSVELLEALRAFLQNEVRDQLEGSARFHALVAANVCGIVAREIELGPAAALAEEARLRELLAAAPAGQVAGEGTATTTLENLNRDLCDHIEKGVADSGPWRQPVLSHIRQTLREKLAIDNPRFRTDAV
jgi:hypothetical protein